MVLADTEPRSPSPDVPRRARDEARGLGRIEVAALALIVVAGVGLRFWTESHLWLDEALTVDIARLPLTDIGGALRQDGHPPLFYWLLHGWMTVFGQGDTAVRALSGLFGVAALPLGYYAGRRAGGARAGWAVVVLLSLSPYAIRYSTEARMYSLVIALVLTGYLLVANALERPRVGLLAGIALVTGALLLSHYWSLWLVVATGGVLVWRAWRTEAARATTVRVLVAVGIGCLFLVPWLPSMLYQSAHTGTPWASVVRPTTMMTETLQDFGGGDFGEGVLLGWSLLGLFALGLLATRIDDRRLVLDLRTVPQVRREAAIVALTFAVAAVAGYLTRTTYATRYAAVVFPLFVLVAAVGLTRLDVRFVREVALAGLLVLGVVGGVHNGVTDRTQAGVVASAINRDLQPGDVVVICPDQLGPSIHRLLPATTAQYAYPTFASPDRVDWRDYAERSAKADPAAFASLTLDRAHAMSSRTIWLVSSGGYKTFEGQCEGLAADLAKSASSVTSVVGEDGDTYFEHAGLLRFTIAS